MTEHTPPTAEEIAANLTASTRKHCTSCADRPRMCPSCDLYDDGVTDMLTALEVAGLLPDENGISHTEPAALPETPELERALGATHVERQRAVDALFARGLSSFEVYAILDGNDVPPVLPETPPAAALDDLQARLCQFEFDAKVCGNRKVIKLDAIGVRQIIDQWAAALPETPSAAQREKLANWLRCRYYGDEHEAEPFDEDYEDADAILQLLGGLAMGSEPSTDALQDSVESRPITE